MLIVGARFTLAPVTEAARGYHHGIGREREMDASRVAELLEARRAELAGELESLRRPVREPGAQLQYGKRVGDHTNEAVEQRTRGVAAARLQQTADEVSRAIEKLAEGTYGRCDRCRRPIPEERLDALPWAALCVPCKSEPARAGRRV